jgi:DNA-binding transcriptional LysR family regulator
MYVIIAATSSGVANRCSTDEGRSVAKNSRSTVAASKPRVAAICATNWPTPSEAVGPGSTLLTVTPVPEEWRFTDDIGKAHDVKISIGMQSNNCDTVRAAALAGRGIILQPTFMIGDDVRKGRLEPLLSEYHLPDAEVLAVYPTGRHLSAKVRVMVDFLIDAFKGIPPWDRQASSREPAEVDLIRA